MKIPLLDINAQNLPLEEELTDAFKRVLHSGRFIMGEEVLSFEREVADFVGAKEAIGVSSGTDALLLALMALDIGPSDEVICPTFTFFATAGCVARVGAIPVFVDACPDSYNINPEEITKKINERTKAIMPVHLFGQSADMDPIVHIAEKHNLYMIEDAAQAIGAKYQEKGAERGGILGRLAFILLKTWVPLVMQEC